MLVPFNDLNESYKFFNMPILIANNWNALRSCVVEDENGNKQFGGYAVVTFFLDHSHGTHATGVTKKVLVEKGTSGKIEKRLEKDEEGKRVVKFYKAMFEHQAVVTSVVKMTHKNGGIDGWSFKLSSDDTVVLPRGRCETKDAIVMSEPPEGSNEEPKPKVVQVRTQNDELLEAIMSIAPEPKKEVKKEPRSIYDMFDKFGRIRKSETHVPNATV